MSERSWYAIYDIATGEILQKVSCVPGFLMIQGKDGQSAVPCAADLSCRLNRVDHATGEILPLA